MSLDHLQDKFHVFDFFFAPRGGFRISDRGGQDILGTKKNHQIGTNFARSAKFFICARSARKIFRPPLEKKSPKNVPILFNTSIFQYFSLIYHLLLVENIVKVLHNWKINEQ